jgi:predicted nucleic acid-binding protein
MAASVIVDASFLVALLNRRDAHQAWATDHMRRFPPPWKTCEAALSEALHLVGDRGAASFAMLLRSAAVVPAFQLDENTDAVLRLMDRYATVPMSLADACLVRMTELLPEPILLTTDTDFRVYRRHSRQVVPCMLPE